MTPDFRITVGGEDATGPIRDRLLSLTITDEDGEKADRIEIEIDDRDGAVEFPEMKTVTHSLSGSGLMSGFTATKEWSA